MSNTIPLKISRKMAELLAAISPEGGTVKLIAAEVAAGRIDKDGAVRVEADPDNGMALLGFALGSLSRLDAALAQAAPARGCAAMMPAEQRGDSLHPYAVEQQPDGQWAVVAPNIGPMPEYTYPERGDAISAARRCLQYDNE
jgi:hypothetical protein